MKIRRSINSLAEDMKPYSAPGRREELIMNLFRYKAYISRQDIQDCLKVSQPAAILILRKMIADGTLIKEGSGKYVRYRPAKPL